MVLMGVLTAIGLTIFMLEAQMPPLTAIPGIKLGLANIVTLCALAVLGPKDALIILITAGYFGQRLFGADYDSGVQHDGRRPLPLLPRRLCLKSCLLKTYGQSVL